MINEDDFKVWLQDPCTQFFRLWLEKNKKQAFDDAAEMCYNQFSQENKPKLTTELFGICNGLERVLSAFQQFDQQLEEDEENRKNKTVSKEEDVIVAMIDYVYPERVGARERNV